MPRTPYERDEHVSQQVRFLVGMTVGAALWLVVSRFFGW